MRKETTFTAEDGRDKGKQYHLREMPASQAEAWAVRALLAVGRAGIEVPPELAAQGMVGLLAIGYMNLIRIPFEDAKPLLEEMMGCVQAIPSANVTRPLIEDDIEEVATRLKLRKAVWELHTDFFTDAGSSTSGSGQPGKPQSTGSLSIKTPRQR